MNETTIVSPRRRNHDYEVVIAVWQVKEITEEMDLLDETIVEEVRAALKDNDELMRDVAHLLRMTNPHLENIAIMSENGQLRIVLLFKDKTAAVLRRRRTALGTVRHIAKNSIANKEAAA